MFYLVFSKIILNERKSTFFKLSNLYPDYLMKVSLEKEREKRKEKHF